MWIVTNINTGKKLYLLTDRSYTVGRVGSDIVLTDDTSISRSHAILHSSNESLKLEDMGSKYGTYHNELIETKQKLPKGKRIELKEGDRILFGALRNEWLISKNNINSMVSSLNAEQLTETKAYLDKLGGHIIPKWEPKCTHLTMSEITITIKVLDALIEKIPIVSCSFWKDYLKNIEEKKQPPLVTNYLPKRSSLLSSAIKEEHLDFNEKRKTLFAGKTFVFMTRKHFETYSPIVSKAGGQCKDLKSNVPKSYLIKKNVIVVQYVASTQSQGSQTINTISDYLEANSLRTIPEYEIGLAIICCSTEKYCNPTFSAISNILPDSAQSTPDIGTLLAENTHSQKSEVNTLELSSSEVPDSDCRSSDKVKTKPNLQSEIYDSDVIAINDDSKSSGSIEFSSVVPESDASTKINKRTRNTTDDIEIQAIKRINFTNDDFSENLVFSSDIPSSSNVKELPQPTEKRKRQLTPTAIEQEPSKKSRNSCVSPETSKKSKHEPAKSKPQEKSKEKVLQVKPTLPGFLQKSQNVSSQQESQNRSTNELSENRSATAKRGRIALITDNDSDNDDDLFNFGSSPKIPKPSGHNSDEEELFGFGNKSSRNAVAQDDEQSLPETQPFVQNKKLNSSVGSLKIKISPIKAAPDGWLSSLNILKIKSDNEIEIKQEFSVEDLKKNEWIDSIKGGFEVRVRKMKLTSKVSNLSTVSDSSSTSLNSTRKNFKAFVKKHNYKTQTQIIPTVPKVVPPVC